MDPVRYQFSIVLAGVNHNPTILNPDFLLYNEIVPSVLTLSPANPPITTPAFARVAYEEGLEVQSDPDKVHFAQLVSTPSDVQFAIQSAAMYAKVLGHVRYVGVGINPVVDYATSAPAGKHLAKRMLQEGPWTASPDLEAGLTLKFPKDLSLWTVNIRGGRRGDQEVIQFQGNIHYAIDEKVGSKSAQKAVKIIEENAAEDQEVFLNTTQVWIRELV